MISKIQNFYDIIHIPPLNTGDWIKKWSKNQKETGKMRLHAKYRWTPSLEQASPGMAQ